MATSLYTGADMAPVSRWAAAHGVIGVHADARTLAVASHDGEGFTVALTDIATAVALLTAVVTSGRQTWAHGATAVSAVLVDRLGVEVPTLLCSRVLATALQPEAIDAPALIPTPTGSASDVAAKVAREVLALKANRPTPAVRAAALRETAVDAAWRPAVTRGYAVDVEALEDRVERLRLAREVSLREHGVDLTENSPEVTRWLSARGIYTPDAGGRVTLSHKVHDSAFVPAGQEAAWTTFREYRDIGRSAGKLSELTAALAGSPDGRLHPVINALGARTGRMSVGQPALQNLSADLRPLLLADEGMTLVGADLDRIEPRIIAALTQDERLIEAVRSDVYVELAVAVWGEEARGDAGKRKVAKTAFLALAYGEGVASLAANLGVTEEAAREARTSLLRAFPTMARWMADVKRRAEAGEPLTTMEGRPLPSTTDAPYRAVNWVIQGSASDLFKTITLDVSARLGVDALWMPVHDELIVQVELRREAEATEALRQAMTMTIAGVQITGTPEVLGDRWVKR